MPGSRPRTKASKKRRMQRKEARRTKSHKDFGIPILKTARK